ncbi:MAG: enoyl-CoA hydratase/isomerase family protein [Bacteroidia bacterium]|nr:enoyl-CoA hydratase/isomerase family protein [Bacteroidia bacterium]
MKKIKLNITHSDAVAQIILDDGKGNVLDHIMMEELQHVLNTFYNNNNLKLISFEGAGKHFSFGASVEEHQKDMAATMLKSFHQLFFTLKDLSIPTIAKISGQCLGGGLELAIMCNQLFADKTAKLGQPEVVLGVFPPPASILLPEKIGLSRAEDLLITGRTINAEEAKEFGLLTRVFENKTLLESETEKWIEEFILPKSASSLKYAVKASRIKFNHVLSNFLPQLEYMYVNQLMNTADANEGINSFLEKRKPVWNNN